MEKGGKTCILGVEVACGFGGLPNVGVKWIYLFIYMLNFDFYSFVTRVDFENAFHITD